MSDHHPHTDPHDLPSLPMPVTHDILTGELMIPATAVTLLLRAIAAGWSACPCDESDCRRTAALYAASLNSFADQLDVGCIAAAGQSADPTY
ncbi:hypothetical protein [Kitasatospora sp. NPDC059327]|uniref:hypothetical protein n=1 Tax=Kitasatospora sp. NPDC059327 TaxID=3346803 RepID=UPI0036B22AE2